MDAIPLVEQDEGSDAFNSREGTGGVIRRGGGRALRSRRKKSKIQLHTLMNQQKQLKQVKLKLK